jgi:hypothetical protein
VREAVAGTAVLLAMAYGPLAWARWRREPPEAWGLSLALTRRGLAEALLVSLGILGILTFPAAVLARGPWPRVPASPETFLALASAGLAAAVAEEPFFRGFLQTLLARRLGPAGGVLGGAALFALAHVPLFGPLAVLHFFPGLVMGVLRQRHGTLAPGMLFHALGNLWAVFFWPFGGP